MRVTRHDSCWVSPFGHPRITARLPTPQGLSQAPTSFIGSRCQGIHHAPFIACLTNQQNNHYKDARVHYPDLKQQPHTTPNPTNTTGPGPGRDQATTHPHQTAGGPDASEPQQRATPTQTTRPPVHEDERPFTGREVDDSTSEHHHAPPTEMVRVGVCAP